MTKARAACPITPPADSPLIPMSLAALAAPARSRPDYPITPPASPRSTAALSEPSHHSSSMMNSPVGCPPSPPPTPPQIPLVSHQKSPKSYMTMDDLFARFAGRQSRKSVETIPTRMRSPRSPMPGQTKTTSCFKPVCQPPPSSAKSFEKLKSRLCTSSISSTPRTCFPVNQMTGTPHIAIGALSNLGNQVKHKMQSSSPLTSNEQTSERGYIAAAGVDHTDKGIRVGTTPTHVGGTIRANQSNYPESSNLALPSADLTRHCEPPPQPIKSLEVRMLRSVQALHTIRRPGHPNHSTLMLLSAHPNRHFDPHCQSIMTQSRRILAAIPSLLQAFRALIRKLACATPRQRYIAAGAPIRT